MTKINRPIAAPVGFYGKAKDAGLVDKAAQKKLEKSPATVPLDSLFRRASPEILKGISEAVAKKLAKSGITSVDQLAKTRALFDKGGFTTRQKNTLNSMRQALQACVREFPGVTTFYGVGEESGSPIDMPTISTKYAVGEESGGPIDMPTISTKYAVGEESGGPV